MNEGVEMKLQIVATVVITILTVLFLVLYAAGIILPLQQLGQYGFITWLAVIIFSGLLLSMIWTGYRRVREIKEESKDDLSKY
jgi:membrane protein implicated in regulation of membrane protease activity